MKYQILWVLIIGLFSSLISAQIPPDTAPSPKAVIAKFGPFPFGITADEMLAIAKKTYKFSAPEKKGIYLQQDGDQMEFDFTFADHAIGNEKGWVEIRGFYVGENKYTVYLQFDFDGKFYRYYLDSESFDATGLDAHAPALESDLCKVFDLKFGKRVGEGIPPIFNIHREVYNIAHEWRLADMTAFTAITEDDNYQFKIHAVVYMNAQQKKMNEKDAADKAADIKKAANGF
jgi:hypothetical protein